MGTSRAEVANKYSQETGEESLDEAVMTWIDGLKKKQLQKELEGRNLSTKGLKDELRDRLVQSMLAEREADVVDSKKINVKSQPATTTDEVAARTNDSMDVSMEKSNVITKSKPSVDEMMEDFATDQDESPAQMEIEAPSLKNQLKTNQNAPSPWKSQDNNGTENHQTSMNCSPNKQAPMKNAGNPTEKTESKNEALRHPSPYRCASPSRSQSPLRRMQSTVQSALRNLRPVSPKKDTEEPKNSPQKPAKQIVALPQTLSTDSTESSHTSSVSDGSEIPATTSSSAPLVPIPGTIRPFTTPALSSSSSSKLGGMSINADSVKAKNNARMARIAEMRNKVCVF